MLKDCEVIVHKIDISEDLVVYPIGDVHLGDPNCMEREFRDYILKLSELPNARIALMGDLINNATRNSVSDIYSERLSPGEAKRLLTEYLKPVADKIILGVPGNHELRTKKETDQDITYDIMYNLECENFYRPNMAFCKIQFRKDQCANGSKNPTYVIAATHGTGGGNLPGGSINRLERFGYTIDGLDGLIMGHTHKPLASAPGKLIVNPRTNRVYEAGFKTMISPSWMRYGGYPARLMLNPGQHTDSRMILSRTHKNIEVIL